MMIRKMEIEMNSDGKRSVEQKRAIGRRDTIARENIGYRIEYLLLLVMKNV